MKSIDYFLPLTRHDEVNLVASKIAKKLGVKKIIIENAFAIIISLFFINQFCKKYFH